MIYEELNKYTKLPVLLGEKWVAIRGFEGCYEISNYGRVKRLAFTTTMYNQTTSWLQDFPEKIYKLNLDGKGYPQVRLSVKGLTPKTVRCHRLVAEHFLEPPSEALWEESLASGFNYVQVEHRDDDPRNPHIDNLRWCSASFNNLKCSEKLDYSDRQGSKQHMAILTEEDVLVIWDLLKGGSYSQTEIGEMFGVKQITISNIKTGRSWHHLTGLPKTKRTAKRKPLALMERSEL